MKKDKFRRNETFVEIIKQTAEFRRNDRYYKVGIYSKKIKNKIIP